MSTPTNLYEYFQSKNQPLPSIQERRTMFGLGTDYIGTEQQNRDLLAKLQTPASTPSFYTPISGVEGPGIPRTGTPPTPPAITPLPTEPPAADLNLGAQPTPELPTPTAVADTKTYTENALKDLEVKKQQTLDAYQKQLDAITKQKEEADKQIADLETKQQVMLETDVKPLLEPFRQAKETAERERLKVEENYFANQNLVGELDGLLTNLQGEVKAIEDVPGLAAIKTGQIAKKKEDVAARVGVIQAVMSARTGQIHEAYSLIDRSLEAIANDRKDQLAYYDSVYKFYGEQKDTEGKKLIQLTKDERDYMDKQISYLENEQKASQESVDKIKEMLIDPKQALMMAEAGITLNDSIPEMNKKMADWSYRKEVTDNSNAMEKDGYDQLITPQQIAAKPADEINWQTDSKGVKRAWWKEKKVEEENKPLSILDIARYQELYPNAGIVAGDTEKTANEKVAKLSQPRDFTEKELEVAITDDKNKNTKYEDVLTAIDANNLIANKDLAKRVAAKIYRKEFSTFKQPEISELPPTMKTTTDAIYQFLFNK